MALWAGALGVAGEAVGWGLGGVLWQAAVTIACMSPTTPAVPHGARGVRAALQTFSHKIKTVTYRNSKLSISKQP